MTNTQESDADYPHALARTAHAGHHAPARVPHAGHHAPTRPSPLAISYAERMNQTVARYGHIGRGEGRGKGGEGGGGRDGGK